MSLIPGFEKILHGGDYNPDQWLRCPEVIEEDFRLMKVTGCNTFSIGIFAWSRLEPQEGSYHFDWLDGIMDRMEAAGHQVILATPSGAKPFWLSERYEEVRRVDRDGKRLLSGGRHNHCWTSPVYRSKVREINARLAERYGKRSALKMWHVSNEYSGGCFCPLCLNRFREWLKDRHGNLETLNEAYWADFWSHRFSDWQQIDPRDPWMGGNHPLDGLKLDWTRFVAWQIEDFFQWEAHPLRLHSPHIPVLTNLMGFYEGVNYQSLAKHLDIIAEDSYPFYDGDDPNIATQAGEVAMKFDLLRCLKGLPRPWFLMESCIDGRSPWATFHLKHPGMHHLEMFQALAHGAEGTLYFQWRKGRGGCEKDHGAVLNHVHPERTRSFQEVKTLNERYDKIAGILGSVNRATAALILDWDSRSAYRAAQGTPDGQNPQSLIAHAAAHHLPLWKRGAMVDVLASTHDFSGYRLLIVPRLYALLPGVAERLKDYVSKGGTVVMTALTGMVNETNLCWTDGCPGDGLEEIAGVWMEEINVLKGHETRQVSPVDGNFLGLAGSWQAGSICARIHERGATTLARYAEGWMKGTPAVTSHVFGKGRVYYVAADLDAAALDLFYEAVIHSIQVPTFYADHTALPHGVSVVNREKGGISYWFLLNFSKESSDVFLRGSEAVDLESGEQVGDHLRLLPWQAKIIYRQ